MEREQGERLASSQAERPSGLPAVLQPAASALAALLPEAQRLPVARASAPEAEEPER